MGGFEMSSFDNNYWNSSDNSILQKQIDEDTIYSTITKLNFNGKIIISTSGTTSSPRLTVISKRAMLCSANSVNTHLNICSKDKWICCLPTTHVSGLSIHARAALSGSGLVQFEGKWSPNNFINQVRTHQVTLCSLVPSQLHDIISLDLRPNDEMRALIIGGDNLQDKMRDKALDLGWPILRTYGMTETCSQVATEICPGDGMKPLEIWNIRLNDDHELLVKGDALFDGYIEQVNGTLSFNSPFSDNDWLMTGDIGILNNDRINIIGRKDEQIKILGEKIDIEHLRSFAAASYGQSITLVAAPDSRKGNRIVMVAESTSDQQSAFEQYNSSVRSIERADELLVIDKLPRSSLGKLRLRRLYEMLENRSDA
ncbi:MAG: AMP-binding protein [Verrucomicrobiota bacterium]|nr:AMP-binding protein [Verrucomicrobiota bacterium]